MNAFTNPSPRCGISLIEVMVSLIVALIGVFGVFVLIPFAVRQVEIGMNQEASLTLARNGMGDFDSRGFQDPTRWALPDTMTAGPPYYITPIPAVPPPLPPLPPPALPYRSRQVFCVDPWGWTLQGLVPGVDPASGAVKISFADVPYTGGPPAAPPNDWPTFQRLSLFDQEPSTAFPDDSVFNRGLARRMFSNHDDLITDPPTDDFSGPTQEFFSSTTGNAGRQYSGRLSWRMFVVREYGVDEYARFYSAVSLARNPDAYDRVFQVNSPGPYSGGGDFTLTELPAATSTPIRRGLWMMLMERDTTGRVVDIAFYRVLESDVDTSTNQQIVTLQGSDITPDVGSSIYAVLFPDVINVYERTMKYETSSDWNLN